MTSSAKDLINKMMTGDQSKRITADKALQHPWIKVRTHYDIWVWSILSPTHPYRTVTRKRPRFTVKRPSLSSGNSMLAGNSRQLLTLSSWSPRDHQPSVSHRLSGLECDVLSITNCDSSHNAKSEHAISQLLDAIRNS